MQEEAGYLPGPERIRTGMQLELQEEKPLTVQSFLEQSELEDRDRDLYSANL